MPPLSHFGPAVLHKSGFRLQATASREFDRMSAMAARHIEQARFFADRLLEEVGFGARLFRADDFSPQVVRHSMEEILEPVVAIGHWLPGFNTFIEDVFNRQ